MEIAMRAIVPLLPKLGNLLVSEYTLKKRVREGIESLVTELTLMHAALRKVAGVPPDQLDEGAKIWAGNVRELSYQMEDAVDAFTVRVENRGEAANPQNRIIKLFKKTTKIFKKGRDLHRISDAIEEAVGQAKKLAELRQRYELTVPDANAGASVDPRVIALYTDATELVGIEDTRDELISMLTEGDDWRKHPLKTVSIVGFGGLGKTTLAKAVFDKIKGQFDCGAFVSVSQNPDMTKVFKDILFKLDKDKYENIHNAARDVGHFIDELREFLNNKRYIIVIDDIWDEKVWPLINCAFSKSTVGSRLITTTRSVTISEACCSSSNGIIYKMKPLSDDASRRLLYRRVFSLENECPDELKQVSRDILKKCGGIPLAIITIASLLASNQQIKTKENWYNLLKSIGRGLTENASSKEMKNILLLSYYDLPSHLKPCLLYLSIYPEDHVILRDNLIWKWIAEGFVHSEKEETCLYELGESYFIELINRSMVQPVDSDHDQRVINCRVHDMVLDLVCFLSSEENFVTILDGTKRKVPNSQIKVRRLSIQKSMVDVATTSVPGLRSLTFFANGIDLVPLISSSRVLRVLDLEVCATSDIEVVENLTHLRYLKLTGKEIIELPMEIGNLQFLQTLNLEDTCVKELPSSIVRLRHLMSLCVPFGTKLPSGICNMKSLEVLESPLLDLNQDSVKELGHLIKLRVLRFVWLGLSESLNEVLVNSLNNLHGLQLLIIYDTGRDVDLMLEGWVPSPQLRQLSIVTMKMSNNFLILPAWINPSSQPLLSSLLICLEKVQPEDIRLLGMLPALRQLTVYGGRSLKDKPMVEMLAVTPDAFPCATECHFHNIGGVPSLFPQGAAPRLKDLRFACPTLWISHGHIDFGMRHLPSLKNVEVDLFDAEANTREEVEEAEAVVRAAAEDHPNHPTVSFSSVYILLQKFQAEDEAMAAGS